MELIERFRLGCANRTLAYRLAPKQYKAGAQMRTALKRVGILRDSGHEHLNGSIVVPVFGHTDGSDRPHAVGAYGRKLLDNLRAGTPKHLYVPGPHRGVLKLPDLMQHVEPIEDLIEGHVVALSGNCSMASMASRLAVWACMNLPGVILDFGECSGSLGDEGIDGAQQRHLIALEQHVDGLQAAREAAVLEVGPAGVRDRAAYESADEDPPNCKRIQKPAR